MSYNLLGGVFQDINRWVANNVGPIGISLLIAMLAVISLFLFSNVVVAILKGVPKIKFKWGQFILLVVCIVLIVWLCLTFNAK